MLHCVSDLKILYFSLRKSTNIHTRCIRILVMGFLSTKFKVTENFNASYNKKENKSLFSDKDDNCKKLLIVFSIL